MNVCKTKKKEKKKELQLHHTNISAPTVTKYLQQNTEEMDLLSSPEATQRKGTQHDRV